MRWNKKDIPHKGWTEIGMEDLGDSMLYFSKSSSRCFFWFDAITFGSCLVSPTITAFLAQESARHPVTTSTCDASSITT